VTWTYICEKYSPCFHPTTFLLKEIQTLSAAIRHKVLASGSDSKPIGLEVDLSNRKQKRVGQVRRMVEECSRLSQEVCVG
jgi:hypothetical protein